METLCELKSVYAANVSHYLDRGFVKYPGSYSNLYELVQILASEYMFDTLKLAVLKVTKYNK